MGFSPGDFRTEDGQKLHWELKGNGRVVLWVDGETRAVLKLDEVNAKLACAQLHTLIELSEAE